MILHIATTANNVRFAIDGDVVVMIPQEPIRERILSRLWDSNVLKSRKGVNRDKKHN